MVSRKNSEAQRQAKTEAAERAAWRRESQLAEDEELAREEQRWHPERQPKVKKDFKNPPPSLPEDANEPIESSPAKDKSSAQQPPSRNPAHTFEDISGIIQNIQQRINSSSVGASTAAQHGSSQAEQDIIQEGLNHILEIIQGKSQGTARHESVTIADFDTQPSPQGESSQKAPEPIPENTRHGSVTLAILRALDAVNRIAGIPQQIQAAVERGEQPAQSVIATGGGSGQAAESHQEPETASQLSAKEKKRAEKKTKKEQRQSLKAEKGRIKKENKYAKKEIKARKKEEKKRERKEKFKTAASAAAADGLPEPSRPLGGGDRAASLSSSSSPSGGFRFLNDAFLSTESCSTADRPRLLPRKLNACRCVESHEFLNRMSSAVDEMGPSR